MNQAAQHVWRQLGWTAIFHAFLGSVLLLLSVGFLEDYFDSGPHRWPRAAYLAAGFLICGAAMLVSSYFVYRRRPNATFFYAASWALNFIGWIALTSISRPVWWVLGTAVCFATGAIVSVVHVRRVLGGRRIAP
jgi:hypothetical protein